MNDVFKPSTGGGQPVQPDQLSTDQLHYMADMISELCEMARRADQRTLAALLALAEAEASREAVRRRSDSAR